MYVRKSHHNIHSTFVVKWFAGLFPRDTQSIRGSMLRIHSGTDGPKKKKRNILLIYFYNLILYGLTRLPNSQRISTGNPDPSEKGKCASKTRKPPY